MIEIDTVIVSAIRYVFFQMSGYAYGTLRGFFPAVAETSRKRACYCCDHDGYRQHEHDSDDRRDCPLAPVR